MAFRADYLFHSPAFGLYLLSCNSTSTEAGMAYKYGTWQLTWLAKFMKPFGDRSGSVSTLARAAQARQVWHSGLVGYFLFGGKD